MSIKKGDSQRGSLTLSSIQSLGRQVTSQCIAKLAALNVFFKRIAVLGFAFKADTGDTRESAAISLIRDFQSERANVNIYDPQVEHSQIWMDLSEASPSIPLDQSEPFIMFR